ncbi:universal stress protein [Pseudomonas sp. RIT288]|uniref:universal stress protein n=1 Tax=Pseudomonas sp. RIT288 TaxID=1470589 RepID=UPI000451F3B8|nr:universal stress protein [Pseudomonas sp. RIT288]EZP30941.1 universal stress protein [Pseudomonas sp. RIT288]
MLRIERMLLIAPSEMTRTPAFDRAVALAQATGAALHMVGFDSVPALAVAGLFDLEAMAQAREGYLLMHRHWLEQQARFLAGSGVRVSSEVVWAKATPTHMLDYINDYRADLVIKDTHHVPALNRAFHRPLDWLLLRNCPAPVHLVTEARHPLPLNILAAVDLSHLEDLTQGLNQRILELAATLANACGAALHVLNVSHWSVLGDAAMSVPTPSLDHSLCEAINDTQQEAFEALAERYAIERQRRHQVTGIPHKMIEQFARQNAFDMLVLGTAYPQGRNGYIGATVESVLNRAPCSLMIAKPILQPH